jgi:hypothetical protein
MRSAPDEVSIIQVACQFLGKRAAQGQRNDESRGEFLLLPIMYPENWTGN